MALTDEDKKRLSLEDQEKIAAATAKWEQAAAAGDAAGKKAAAEEAKKIREQAGYYTDSYGRYEGELPQSDPFLEGFLGEEYEPQSTAQTNLQQTGISTERTAPPRGYDGMYSVEGGSGKSFIYDPVEGTIEVFRPDGSQSKVNPGDDIYDITYKAMEDDTGYDFTLAEPNWEIENMKAFYAAKDALELEQQRELEKKAEEVAAKAEELYQKYTQAEKEAEAKATTQNRNLYAGYMQEIDPYGEFAEKIAKKGLTKSGYPLYDYEGFKKAFEAQAGDNMQNLRQLKAELQAALKLAIDTENEKLEEALLDYREKLARLEQEYSGKVANKEGRIISLQEAADKAVFYPRIAKQGEEEEIKTFGEFPNDRKVTNLLLRRDADDVSGNGLQNSAGSKSKSKSDTAMQELVEISPPQEYIPEIKKNSNVYEVFREAGYSFQRVDYGIFDEYDDINIVDENGNIVYLLECYKDFQWDWKGDPVFENSATTNEKLLALLADSPRERKRAQLAEMLENSATEGGISPQALSLMYEGFKEFEDDEEIQNLINEITQDPEIASEWKALSAADKDNLGSHGASEAILMTAATIVLLLTGIQIPTHNDTFDNILTGISVVSSCFAVGLARKIAVKIWGKPIKKIIGKIITSEKALKGIGAALAAWGIGNTAEDVKTFLEYCLEIDMEPEPIPYVRGEYRSPFGFQN